MNNDTLIPYIGVVTDIRQDTPDVKTFRVVSPEGGKVFEHMPGQCAMLSIPGVGEAMFSITSSPTYNMAPRYGRRSADNYPRTLRQCFPC